MRVITTEVEAKMVAARLNSKGVGDADIATVSAAISYFLPHFTCMQQLQQHCCTHSHHKYNSPTR